MTSTEDTMKSSKAQCSSAHAVPSDSLYMHPYLHSSGKTIIHYIGELPPLAKCSLDTTLSFSTLSSRKTSITWEARIPPVSIAGLSGRSIRAQL